MGAQAARFKSQDHRSDSEGGRDGTTEYPGRGRRFFLYVDWRGLMSFVGVQAMNAVPLRKDERGSSGPSSDRKNRRNVSNDDGWSTATSRNRTSFTIQSDKLKNRAVSTTFCYKFKLTIIHESFLY